MLINAMNEEENVKTSIIQNVLLKPAQVAVKTHLLLLTVVTAVFFLLIGQHASANQISRSDVLPVTVNMGEEISFHSSNLNEQREFYLRLPNDYQQTKHDYPVIYLLDANNETLTYMKDLYFHSVLQIERLMEHGDIPQSIIVGIPFKSSQWFSNVIGNSAPFRDYLTDELAKYINDNYRTLNHNILIGQSYSAVFVINALPSSSDTFNAFIAIEPVLAAGRLEDSVANYQNISVKKGELQIIMGGGSLLDEAKVLTQQIVSSVDKGINVSLKSFANESHGSVYYPALNYGLRSHFTDYREPSEELLASANFGHQELKNYFAKRAAKYQVEVTDREFHSAIFSSLYHNLLAKKFEQAFALWPIWQSQNKVYNANRAISHFLRKNDRASAITLLQHLAKAMPTSVVALDRLASLYQQNKQPVQAKDYQQKTQQLLTQIFNKPVSNAQEVDLNLYGYSLLQQKRNQEALSVFKRISQANPESTNAYDSLADAYEATKNYQLAIETLESGIAVAVSQNASATTFQQKINRIKSLR